MNIKDFHENRLTQIHLEHLKKYLCKYNSI